LSKIGQSAAETPGNEKVRVYETSGTMSIVYARAANGQTQEL